MSNTPKKPGEAPQESAFITPPNEIGSHSITPNIHPEEGVLSSLEEEGVLSSLEDELPPRLQPVEDTTIIPSLTPERQLLSAPDARFLRLCARTLLVIAAVFGIGWLFWQSGSALMPFIIGIVVGYLLL